MHCLLGGMVSILKLGPKIRAAGFCYFLDAITRDADLLTSKRLAHGKWSRRTILGYEGLSLPKCGWGVHSSWVIFKVILGNRIGGQRLEMDYKVEDNPTTIHKAFGVLTNVASRANVRLYWIFNHFVNKNIQVQKGYQAVCMGLHALHD